MQFGDSTMSLRLSVGLGRMELPDGLGVSVPQLARLRLGVCVPLRGRHRRPQRHAREPPLLPGGQELHADG